MKYTTSKIMALAVSVQLLAPMVAPMTAAAAMFPDTRTNWAGQAISTLSDEGILIGYPDGSFRPNGLITRAEFAAMMTKALSLNTTGTGSQSFNDVPRSHWAFPAVETVRSTGLVSGYPNGLFMPGRSISRAEAMAVLVNASRVPVPSEAQTAQILSQFRDAGSVPGWARPGVAAAIQAGLFANDPQSMNEIDPLQPATRAEVAAMVQNMRELDNVATTPMPQQQQPAAQQQQPQQGYQGGTMTQQAGQQTLQARIATVPAQTTFTGTLTSPVSSELNRPGDTVVLRTDQPLVSQDGTHVIVPTGSQIIGKITEVREAERVTMKPGMLDIDFNEIITPSGERYTIQGSVATEDGMLAGDSTKGRILKSVGATAAGAGLGAALGTAMGPLSGGSVGKGAIWGTAIGAGVGAVGAAAVKGKEVKLQAGDQLEMRLDQPITVQVQPL